MTDRPFWLSSIKNKLTLLFFSITAGAILIVSFYVIPQLQSSLTSQKVDGLKRDAATYSRTYQGVINTDVTNGYLKRVTDRISQLTGTRVTLFGVPQNELNPGQGPSSPPYVITDSRAGGAKIQPSNSLVLKAAHSGHLRTATLGRGGHVLAQAARPVFYQGGVPWVVVFSASLDDVTNNVALIRRQILIAGVIALLVAMIAGYYFSTALARRVKRLEGAAVAVAAGDFSEPIPIDSEDELGQLARAFNEMQHKLARVDDARKEFIANASHELRTPIFSLGGFVELLQDEDLDEPTREEFLTTMREQVERLQKLATDLLDLSRLDAGSLELEIEPVPLRSLAQQVSSEFAAAAARNGSMIEVPGQSERDIEATCDQERVTQILRVLVDNGITHTDRGTRIVVTVRKSQARNGRAVAELLVTDNGPGIPSRDLPHVFERFHSGTGSGQGSGLGLAIARELAQRMRGSLEVKSRPGRTVFKLTLPLAGEWIPPAGRIREPAKAEPTGMTAAGVRERT